MNRNETLTLLAYLAEAYPGRSADPKARLAVWSDALSDVNGEAAMGAARHLTKTSTFPPSVADILRAIGELDLGVIPSWVEAKSIIESSHYAPGELASAHPVVREIARRVVGPITLAAIGPEGADRSIRSAHHVAVARYTAGLSHSGAREIEAAPGFELSGMLMSVDEAIEVGR